MATFQNVLSLRKASFLTTYNYSIDPEMNKIKKARFSQMGIAEAFGSIIDPSR